MSKPKVLFAFAHPDDEVICGWPLLQSEAYEKEILICSSDLNNPQRKKYQRRKYALFALCEHLGLPCRCLDYSSDFYAAPSRMPRKRHGLRKLLPLRLPPFLLRDVCSRILSEIETSECDFVFTHNFWGEYGHMDHVLLNTLIFNNIRKPIFITNMRLPLDWLPLAQDVPDHVGLLQGRLHSSHTIRPDFYEECAAVYKQAKVWTWSQPPLPELNLYLFGHSQPEDAPDA